MDNKTFFNIVKWLIVIGMVFFLAVIIVVTFVTLPDMLF